MQQEPIWIWSQKDNQQQTHRLLELRFSFRRFLRSLGRRWRLCRFGWLCSRIAIALVVRLHKPLPNVWLWLLIDNKQTPKITIIILKKEILKTKHELQNVTFILGQKKDKKDYTAQLTIVSAQYVRLFLSFFQFNSSCKRNLPKAKNNNGSKILKRLEIVRPK